MKVLKHESFNIADGILDFVKEKKIKQKDIQQISHNIASCHIYYWEIDAQDTDQDKGKVYK